MKYLKLLGVISIAIVITACGSDIEGGYIDKNGEGVILSNGKVIIGDKKFDYELEDNKIRVKVGQGKIKTLTLEEDGSITMPGGEKLIKQKGAKRQLERQYEAKKSQHEAKSNLGSIFTSQITYHSEHDVYTQDISKLDWKPRGNLRYTYTISNASPTSFVATAKANLDGDPTVDEWRIDQDKILTNVTNDVTN